MRLRKKRFRPSTGSHCTGNGAWPHTWRGSGSGDAAGSTLFQGGETAGAGGLSARLVLLQPRKRRRGRLLELGRPQCHEARVYYVKIIIAHTAMRC